MSPGTSVPAAGDVVEVDWGLGTVEATVVDAYRTGRGVRVTVSVPIQGADDEALDHTVVTFPLDAVRSLPEIPS